MLASHENRDKAITKLQDAFLAGHLDENELEDRVSSVLHARSTSDLAVILKDIPIKPTLRPSFERASSISVFSNIERHGHFFVPESSKTVAVFGSCKLDLSSAKFESAVTKLHVVAVFGNVEITVPHGIRVFLHQIPVLANISSQMLSEDLSFHAPELHITGVAVLGNIEIHR